MTNFEIAHMSDLHYSPINLTESDACFGFAVEDAIRRKVRLAIISGDSTDHLLHAHAPSLIVLARRLKQLADHCPVLMLQGTFSHEPVGMLQILGLIGAKHQIMIADKIGMVALSDNKWIEFDPVNVAQGQYDLVVTCVPTVNKADLAILVGAENAAVEMGNHLAALLSSHGPINAKLRECGIPTVLVSHGTVDGSETEHGVPMAGLDHEFTAGSLFAANTDAVMLGHIHKLQTWEREFQGVKQVIAYPGSIGRFHYGEYGEKHYLVWNLEAGNARFEAVVTPSRRMIDLEFTGAPNLDEIAAVVEECKGAYVRVRYQVDEEFAKTVDRNGIKELLASAAEVKIEGSVFSIQRQQRCPGISTLSSIPDRFMKWADTTDTPKDGLAERIAMLESMEAVDIVAKVLPDAKSLVSSPASKVVPECFEDLFP